MLSNVTERTIEWGDCDPAGIVFNPNYYAYFDHAFAMLCAAGGHSKSSLIATFGIVGCPIVDVHATFRASSAYGDEVSILSQISEIGRSSFEVRHILSNNGKVCVEAVERRVWTIRDPSTGYLRSCPLPEKMISVLKGEDDAT